MNLLSGLDAPNLLVTIHTVINTLAKRKILTMSQIVIPIG